MNIHKLFPSRWVGAQDLEGHTPKVTIRALTVEMVGAPPQNEEKPVLWFQGKEKGLILNKTNGLAIAALYGPETDNWVGKQIQLYTANVKAFGAVHEAIRVRSAGTVSAAPDPVVDAEPEDIIDEDDPGLNPEYAALVEDVMNEWSPLSMQEVKSWMVEQQWAESLAEASGFVAEAKARVLGSEDARITKDKVPAVKQAVIDVVQGDPADVNVETAEPMPF